MYHDRVRVLVVGGSLVGLSTALLLAHRGVETLLVERNPLTSDHPRARAFHARTMELLTPSGVPALLNLDQSLTGSDFSALVAERVNAPTSAWWQPPVQPLPLSPASSYSVNQDRLEPIIAAMAIKHGAELGFGTELLSFQQDRHGVTATVQRTDTGHRRVIRADYLVGADGPDSRVRERLGIPLHGAGVLSRTLTVVFRADLGPALAGRSPYVIVLTAPDCPGVLLSTDQPDRWVLGRRLGQGDPLEVPDQPPAHWVELVRTAVGEPGLDVTVEDVSVWSSAEQIAERYGSGRVFLAGDAAERAPLAGGHGANLGIQSAANLAWKLAAVCQGWAGPTLLDSYDAERRPVGLAVAAQGAALEGRHLERFSGQLAQPTASYDAVMYGHRYPVGRAAPPVDPVPEVLRLTGEPGSRLPHVWVEQDGGLASTIELCGPGLTLFSSDPGWLAAAEEVAATTDAPLRARPTAGWQQACSVAVEGALLVRPDHVVAARWPGLVTDPTSALRAALDRTLHRVPPAGLRPGPRP